ncbi:Carrier protein, mitochondrial [Madurella fahalii]|uniref:Carrier protein, mitochondrial n=1 Tax=Madurella fahalii TaxID=1157608 RepID=A0ABQ0FZI3_9PEZI
MASFTQNAHTAGVGQGHDRIDHHDDPSADPVEITAVQKMLSATSGSLLTGLLATPLDVVRVRWQSQSLMPQHSPTVTADLSKLPLSTPNAFRPSNLGVTACCREVFFMNNTSDVCVVGPRLPVASIGGNTTTTLLTNSTLGNPSATATTGIACAVEQTQQRTFNSTLDGLRKIARNEGLLTLWRGLSPTLIMAIPANIIYFTGYDWLRYNRASPIKRVRDEYAPLVAGSVARVLAATAVSPIELFRTRLQAAQGPGHLAQTFRGVKDMVRVHGYRSLWRGLTLTLWRDVPFSGMYWWGYETIRGRLTDAREHARGRSLDLEAEGASGRSRARARRRSQSRENHADTFTDSFIAGAASGGFASLVTMPFDVGKTRTQVFRDSSSSSSSSSATAAAAAAEKAAVTAAAEEKNMARLLWHIFRTEGIPGLFRGWIPRTLRVAPACAIMISSYEVGKRVFRGVNERALLREHQHQHQHPHEL